MNSLAISLAVGASGLFTSAASAAPLSADVSVTPPSNVQNVRMVCNETAAAGANAENAVSSSASPVIPMDTHLVSVISSGYAPRERYIERREYRGYDEDRGGIGFRAPGVSVGIGTDRY
jgi:hypothetical protein